MTPNIDLGREGFYNVKIETRSGNIQVKREE